MALFDLKGKTPGTPANHLHRFLAFMLDGFVLITISAPFLLVIGQNMPLVLVMNFVLPLVYHTYCYSSPWQATPGKRIMHLYVTDAKGQRLTRPHALERALGYTLAFIPQYFSLPEETIANILFWTMMLWFMPIFYTQRRTGIHDMLCRTRVVNGRIDP